MEETKKIELTEEESKRLDEVVGIYRNVYNACNIITEEVTQFSKLGMIDEDIAKINEVYDKRTEELFKYVGDIEYFREHCDKIFGSLV